MYNLKSILKDAPEGTTHYSFNPSERKVIWYKRSDKWYGYSSRSLQWCAMTCSVDKFPLMVLPIHVIFNPESTKWCHRPDGWYYYDDAYSNSQPRLIFLHKSFYNQF